jgi:LPXTG-motif cell wall-anchored protein
VTLNAYTNSSTQEAVLEDQTLTFSPTSLPNGWTVVTSTDGKKTTYKVNDLPAVTAAGDTLTYYVVETQVTGYKEPSYADKDGHGLINVGKATNGQQIINAPEDGVALPSTGGPGTLLYTLSGLALICGAALMFIFRMRRRERRLN